jgi:hypothetical protein
MNTVFAGPRTGGAALVSLVDEIVTELERIATESDVGWLQPLLVLQAEIEFTAIRARRADPATLADESEELGALLTRAHGAHPDFAARYANAHGASPRLRGLHERTVDVCRALLADATSHQAPRRGREPHRDAERLP